MPRKKQSSEYLICVKNDGYAVSLELRKVYKAIPDDDATSAGYVRVVDESGEDYLFPVDFFVPIDLPKAATSVFSAAAM